MTIVPTLSPVTTENEEVKHDCCFNFVTSNKRKRGGMTVVPTLSTVTRENDEDKAWLLFLSPVTTENEEVKHDCCSNLVHSNKRKRDIKHDQNLVQSMTIVPTLSPVTTENEEVKHDCCSNFVTSNKRKRGDKAWLLFQLCHEEVKQ